MGPLGTFKDYWYSSGKLVHKSKFDISAGKRPLGLDSIVIKLYTDMCTEALTSEGSPEPSKHWTIQRALTKIADEYEQVFIDGRDGPLKHLFEDWADLKYKLPSTEVVTCRKVLAYIVFTTHKRIANLNGRDLEDLTKTKDDGKVKPKKLEFSSSTANSDLLNTTPLKQGVEGEVLPSGSDGDAVISGDERVDVTDAAAQKGAEKVPAAVKKGKGKVASDYKYPEELINAPNAATILFVLESYDECYATYTKDGVCSGDMSKPDTLFRGVPYLYLTKPTKKRDSAESDNVKHSREYLRVDFAYSDGDMQTNIPLNQIMFKLDEAYYSKKVMLERLEILRNFHGVSSPYGKKVENLLQEKSTFTEAVLLKSAKMLFIEGVQMETSAETVDAFETPVKVKEKRKARNNASWNALRKVAQSDKQPPKKVMVQKPPRAGGTKRKAVSDKNKSSTKKPKGASAANEEEERVGCDGDEGGTNDDKNNSSTKKPKGASAANEEEERVGCDGDEGGTNDGAESVNDDDSETSDFE